MTQEHDPDCATQFSGENSDATTHHCTCKKMGKTNQFKCQDCLDSGAVPTGEEQGQILYSECPTCKKHNPMTKITATPQEIVEAIISQLLIEFGDNEIPLQVPFEDAAFSLSEIREAIIESLSTLPTLRDDLEALNNYMENEGIECNDGLCFFLDDTEGDNPMSLWDLYTNYLTDKTTDTTHIK